MYERNSKHIIAVTYVSATITFNCTRRRHPRPDVSHNTKSKSRMDDKIYNKFSKCHLCCSGRCRFQWLTVNSYGRGQFSTSVQYVAVGLPLISHSCIIETFSKSIVNNTIGNVYFILVLKNALFVMMIVM